MQSGEGLTERQFRILEAVIQIYVETAQPAGSQATARRSRLGISPASVRTTMGELEIKGYLFHTHTSGGRIPTDRGYRLYVNRLMRPATVSESARAKIKSEIHPGSRNAIDEILHRAAQVLGVLTQELGVAIAPTLDGLVLERLELVRVSSERLLAVLTLQSGLVRTIFVEVPASVAADAVEHVSRILNERLAGLTLGDIRSTLPERLRDVGTAHENGELINIFVAQGEDLFDLSAGERSVVLGSAQPLADQPEFASNGRMRDLLHLTERRDLLRQAFEDHHRRGLTITIGTENTDPKLSDFTLVTSSYERGGLSGVIGVLGPTRMPYDKIIGLVEHT
ncbi:MAG TPA: heat-inducible transcriptional repressor HrcA, partial [Gemmatimonadales bacterium]|nr:heat-inducible transcriptional repressor HrcA [Gemmatimonadales bacterium]